MNLRPEVDVPPTQRDVALTVYQRTQRVLGSVALARLLLAIPRTLRFVADNFDRRLSGVVHAEPTPEITARLAAQVAVDEAVLALAMGPNRFPRRRDYERVGAELRACRELFAARGWLDDPASYHRTPPPLAEVSIRAGRTLGSARAPLLRFESLRWRSEFEPHAEEPGAERWRGYEPNRTAGAWVLRHRDGARDRPWLICIHGFGLGYPLMDFGGFEGKKLHDELGLNLALPVLPLHGYRKVTKFSGEAFLSFDLVNTLHGLTQSVWDLRRLLSWIRTQSEGPIGVYGVSLGAYVASLAVCVEPGVHSVLAGIPVSDFPSLYESHSPTHIRLRAISHEILGGAANVAHRVVSPLAMAPLVPHERRFIYAGLADRMARPSQAQRLWRHWGEPEICWYHGNHVGYLWASEARAFVRHALRRSLLGAESG